MEWVTTTGKSLAEAKERALDQLGVAEDDAEFEIIDEPRPGLFGRVRGEAKVRARVRPTQARPKADRRDRRKPKRGDGAAEGDGAGSTDGAETTTAAPSAGRAAGGRGGRSGRSGQRTSAAPVGAGESSAASMSAAAAAEALLADLDADVDADGDAGAASDEGAEQGSDADQGAAGGTAARRRRRGGRGRGTRSTGPDGARADGDDADDNDEFDSPRAGTGSTQQEEPVDAQQVGDEARTFVQGLVDAFGLEGTTSVRVEGDDLEVAVDGNDLGLLVGPRGTTLQAVQELARVAAQRRHGDHDTRLRVDVGGYRVRRREALTRFALDQAAQVVAEGAARALEPMSSSDRKVIHDALAEFDGVATRSEGDDPARRVVIAPAND